MLAARAATHRLEVLLPAARGTVSEGRKHPCFIYVYSDADGRRCCLHVPRELVVELRRRLDNGRRIDRILFEAGAEFTRSRGGAD